MLPRGIYIRAGRVADGSASTRAPPGGVRHPDGRRLARRQEIWRRSKSFDIFQAPLCTGLCAFPEPGFTAEWSPIKDPH